MAKILTDAVIAELKEKVELAISVTSHTTSTVYTNGATLTVIKMGRVVQLVVDNIKITNYDVTGELVTGLPRPAKTTPFMLCSPTKEVGGTNTFRTIITPEGVWRLNYGAPSLDSSYSGSVVYIAIE